MSRVEPPPTKKRKNNQAEDAPQNSPTITATNQIIPADVLTNILSFTRYKFILQSAMLVSHEWKWACLNTPLSVKLVGCNCLIVDEEEEDAEDEEEEEEAFNLKVFCQCPNIASTTSLDLEYNEMDQDSTKWIAQSPFLHNLEHLYLNNCIIESGGALHLAAQNSCLSKLKTLHLECSEIGMEGVKSLANSSVMSNLTSLDLYKNGIGNEGLEQIAKSKYLKKLTHLDLESNDIDDKGLEFMIASENFSELKYLSLSENSTMDPGSLKKCSFPKLQTLKLRMCGLTFEDCKSLENWSVIPQLTTLEIQDNDFEGEEELQELYTLFTKKNNKLQFLLKNNE